jgi:hypothetical protein
VSNGEHGTESLEIDIGRADVMASRHAELRHLGQGGLDWFSRKGEQSLLGARSPGINEIKDCSLRFPNDGRMRFHREVTNCRRMPVVAAGHSARRVHALLYDRPFSRSGDDEAMKVELKAIRDRIVVYTCGQTASSGERIAIHSGALGKCS